MAKEPSADDAGEDFFEKRVRPILVAKCQSCHGPKKQEFGLRLDSRAGVLAGSDDGAVVKPGKPASSRLIAAINYGGDIQMPPKQKLAGDEIAAITRWVKLGLPWPKDDSPAAGAKPPSGEERHKFARASHWSLQPIRRPSLPAVTHGTWPGRPLDRFVLAKLEAAGLRPSPPADRRTLIRRATYDLLGLPPSPEEIDAFASDNSPDAYERLVDRLLASPRYGERWGRHWLDVARYADTKGYAFGRERRFPFAYTYRDWVIRALNEDLPYDQFVLRQLAADQLDDLPNSQLAALGFLTVGRKYNNDNDDIDDQIDTLTRGLLGLTVACARCHDHKYDPIPTADYYSLYGVFASSTPPDEYPLIGTPEDTPGYAGYKAELDKRQKKLDDFAAQKHAELLEKSRANTTDYLVRVVTKKPDALLAKLPFLSLNADELKPELVTRWRQHLLQPPLHDHPVWMPLVKLQSLPDEKFAEQAAQRIESWKDVPPERLNRQVKAELIANPPASKEELARTYGQLLSKVYSAWKAGGANDAARDKLPPDERPLLQELLGAGTPTDIPVDKLLGFLIRDDRNNYRKLEKEVHTHMARSPGAPARAMSLVDKPRAITPQIFIRGNHLRRGDQVPRQFLRVLAGDGRKPFAQGSGRLEMAREIVAADNPLTARVIVNRLWQHHFGKPLVATPSDFGLRSDGPSHPDLLDYLAFSLQDQGEMAWSLKALHREMMLSATYRQASVDRPDCRAVDAENRLLWRANRRRLEFEALRDSLLSVAENLDTRMHGKPIDIFADTSARRRSVYAFIDRQDLPGVLRVFDFANPDQSSAGRPATTVPQQSLFMLNSPFVIAQVKALVGRQEIAAEGEESQRIRQLYRLVLCREATDDELKAAEIFVAQAVRSKLPGDKLSPLEQYAQLLLMTNEFMFVD